MNTRIGVLALLGGVLVAAAWQARATAEIVSPANRATVSSPVKLVLKATGVEIAPATEERAGTGHHHLFVDHDVTVVNDTIPRGVSGILHLGRGQTEFVFDSTTTVLKPGSHRIIDVVADWHHSPLKPWAADTVTFTVK